VRKSELRELIKEEVKKILQEIGDSSAGAYEFDYYGDMGHARVYGFETPSYPYTVELAPDDLENNILDVRFFVTDEEDPDEEKDDIVTNKGELFRVMATVAKIIKQDLQDNPEIDTLTFSPALKKSENLPNSSRLNLYLKFIKHEYPKATATIQGSTIFVKLK